MIHRDVGMFHYFLDRGAILREQGYAYARAGMQFVTLDGVVLSQRAQDLVGHLEYGGAAFQFRQRHYKLVSAQAGNDVAVAHAGLQALCYLNEQHVADVVAEGVIDGFETIQIDKHHRHFFLVALCRADCLQQALHQGKTVGQVGQRVVVGQMADLVCGGLVFGDVREAGNVIGHFIFFIAHRSDGQPGPCSPAQKS